jgi:hypothetical protein
MRSRLPRAKWLDLYLIIGAFLGALWLAVRAHLSETNMTILGVVLLGLLYILLLNWLKDNETGIVLEDCEKYSRNKQNDEVNATQRTEELQQASPVYSGRSLPLWLAAITSIITDFFHRL